MKQVFLISGLFCSLSLFSQENPYDHAFVKRRPGIMRLYTGLSAPDETTPDKFDRFNTDIFFNSWLGEQGGTSTYFYSVGHNMNLMFDIPFQKKSVFGIGVGFGYSHFSIRHNGEFQFMTNSLDEDYSLLQIYTGPKRWSNRTSFTFVEVPFEFRIRAARERGKFKFYPGFKVGFMVVDYHKWRIGSDEYKEFNFPDLNRLHYGPTLRIGFDNYMLFGYYDLTSLFTHDSSNKLQLFSLGISIGWF
ncbi:MAG: outer membrane beta-barrel protein [Crocinitomicaceae bacterium]|nr:outer membrane beta-barrel protein [Crocinitomicaceae bacterium]MBK8927811.1 outer membrane beta-barrel protein [Crocinitomicaceae bacterium]